MCCTCAKDNIIEEKKDYEAIGLCGFDYKLFEEEEGGGVQEGLYRYPYFMHIIKLWKGFFQAYGENKSSGW